MIFPSGDGAPACARRALTVRVLTTVLLSKLERSGLGEKEHPPKSPQSITHQ